VSLVCVGCVDVFVLLCVVLICVGVWVWVWCGLVLHLDLVLFARRLLLAWRFAVKFVGAVVLWFVKVCVEFSGVLV